MEKKLNAKQRKNIYLEAANLIFKTEGKLNYKSSSSEYSPFTCDVLSFLLKLPYTQCQKVYENLPEIKEIYKNKTLPPFNDYLTRTNALLLAAEMCND